MKKEKDVTFSRHPPDTAKRSEEKESIGKEMINFNIDTQINVNENTRGYVTGKFSAKQFATKSLNQDISCISLTFAPTVQI